MIRLTLRGGLSYVGDSVESILREEFGPQAFFRPSADPTSPEGGVILEPVPYEDLGAYNILAAVLDVEQIEEEP